MGADRGGRSNSEDRRELLRYPGLDYPALPFFPEDTDTFEEAIASTNWQTILCDELAERIGGEASLRALGEGYPLSRYDGGYIIQAGPEPELGDREQGDFLPQYGKVHDLLRPLYPPLEELEYLTSDVSDYDPHTFKKMVMLTQMRCWKTFLKAGWTVTLPTT